MMGSISPSDTVVGNFHLPGSTDRVEFLKTPSPCCTEGVRSFIFYYVEGGPYEGGPYETDRQTGTQTERVLTWKL